MKKHLTDYLETRKTKNYISFQMPGHKCRLKDSDLYQKDVTEFLDTDNLHNQQGLIKKSSEEIAGVYGCKGILFSVGGATDALKISIMASTNPGDKIIIQRNSHMSVYNALIVGDLKPIYLDTRLAGSLPLGISLDEFKSVLDENPDAKTVVLLNPSFLGIVGDIEEIVKYAHEKGVTVIVDEAHGAHLPFDDALPKAAVELGADLVIQSTHKNLPSLTQTAIIQIGETFKYVNRLYMMSNIVQTTSPSYLLMASIENGVYLMDKYREDGTFSDIIKYTEMAMAEMEKIEGVKVLPKIFENKLRDVCKLVISVEGISGKDLVNRLFTEFGILFEYGDFSNAVALVSANNIKQDFDALVEAVKKIAKEQTGTDEKVKLPDYVRGEMVLTPREAFYSKSKLVDLEDCVGMVSQEIVVPYPPGIPLIVPGERILIEHLDVIYRCQEIGVDIVMEDRRKIRVIE